MDQDDLKLEIEDYRVVRQRGYELGDAQRRFLFAINSGGIAAIFAIITWISGLYSDASSSSALVGFVRNALAPLGFFLTGLAFVGVSTAFALHRIEKKADAFRRKISQPRFEWYDLRSGTWWTIASATSFFIGTLCLYRVLRITVLASLGHGGQ